MLDGEEIQAAPPERTVASVQQEPPSLSVWELAARLDRTVLLGDPGGGKQVFRDWAEGKVNFTAPALDSPDQNTGLRFSYAFTFG